MNFNSVCKLVASASSNAATLYDIVTESVIPASFLLFVPLESASSHLSYVIAPGEILNILAKAFLKDVCLSANSSQSYPVKVVFVLNEYVAGGGDGDGEGGGLGSAETTA